MDTTFVQSDLIRDFYVRQRVKLIRFAEMRLPFPEESEDVVQDVFLRLLGYRKMVRRETIDSFVYTILRNIINDKLRQFRCHQEIDSLCFDHVENKVVNDTEHAVNGHALSCLIEQHIGKLPPACSRIYSHHLFEGLSADELAEKFSISKRTVEFYLFQARKYLRKVVREEWCDAV